jgi:hypothetical protein
MRPGVRGWMFAIGLFAVLPMLAFSLLSARTLVNQKRTELHADLQRASDVAARELAREVRVLFATLDALAVSDAAQRGDYASLHTQATRVAALQPRIGSIAAVDADGVRKFTTLAPFSVKLPASTLAEFDKLVVRTGERQISPLVNGSISGRKLISLAVPVKKGDQVTMVLRLSLWSEAIGEVVHEQGWPTTWQAGVVDQNMIVIARSADEGRYVGQPTTESVRTALRAGTRGPFAILGRDNAELTATVSPVAGTAWHVITAAPSTSLDEQVMSALGSMLWIGLVCALLSGFGVWMLARSLRRQIQAAADFATTRQTRTAIDAATRTEDHV